ncbi:MAG: glycosyltransferase family 2 protein [Clostridiales bacterium]|nr:glycosyltransferase family 2 protein [Clostridiales bacterium]
MENIKVSVIVPVYNVENFIYDMLKSIQVQHFKDFEVIIVNDGSPDNSQVIIDDFCKNDRRFKSIVQENQGVAGARNNGLKRAKGEYIVFYDPDDYIPRDAIGRMYKSISRENADLAIGAMSMVRAGEYRVNGNTLKLSKKKEISRTDPDLLWSFSVCNKIFRRAIVTDNKLQFEAFKHAEDALFLFKSIFNAKKIVGCPAVVYQYRIRPFWEEKSATQMISTSYLQDVIKALDEIEKLDLSMDSDIFSRAFYVRYCEVSLIAGYYRQLWAGEDEALEILCEKISSLKDSMGDSAWKQIVSRNLDLQLDKDLFTKDAVRDNAVLSVVIKKEQPKGSSYGGINGFLESLYDQCMPSFVVIVEESLKPHIEEGYLQKTNLFLIEDIGSYKVETELVMYGDTRILHSKNSVKMMVNAMLRNSSIDCVTAPIKVYRNEELCHSIQEISFTTRQVLKKGNKRGRTKADQLDHLLGNKIFRSATFERAKGDTSGLSSKKIINGAMIIRGDDGFVYDECPNPPSQSYISFKRVQKKTEDKLISCIKRHFTKDDVKKILRRDI